MQAHVPAYPSHHQKEWLNWPLLLLIALVPLQNIYLGKIPSFGSGLNVLNILMIIALLAASARAETRFGNSMNRCIIFLVLSYLFSYLVGSFSAGFDDNRIFILKDMFFAYLFFFVTYKSLTGKKALKAICWATVIPLPYMFRVFYTNLSWMGFSTYSDKLRFNSGTFMNLGSNEIAAFYATYTFIILAMALVERGKKRKLFLYFCVAMNSYSLLYAFSRGAYLASIVGVLVFCWLTNKMKMLSAGLAIVVIVMMVGVEIFPKSVTERFSSSFVVDEELDDGAQKRKILWGIAVKEFEASPLVGVGFNNFKKLNEFGLDTHNFYAKLLVEGGLVGFFTFLFFLYRCFRSGLTLLKTANHMISVYLAIGFIACISSLAVGNFFGDRFTHYPLISYLFVYLAVVTKLNDQTTSAELEKPC